MMRYELPKKTKAGKKTNTSFSKYIPEFDINIAMITKYSNERKRVIFELHLGHSLITVGNNTARQASRTCKFTLKI